MPETVASELLKIGILGPVLVAALWFIYKLYVDLREAEKSRVKDIESIVDKLMLTNQRWQEAFTAHSEVVKSNSAVLAEVRETMKDMEELLLEVSRQGQERRQPVRR
jgi:type II secretory pathway component PulC